MENNHLELKEEEICGYTVSVDIKKLWNVLLDILSQIDRICKKYNIRYFAGAGTLLGAVRHKGFVPWDDDIDVFMLQDDYMKFCEVAEKELSYPYFFQCYKGNDIFWPDMVMIRRSDTTGCSQRAFDNYIPPANFGMFVDIFPLTNTPDNKLAFEMQTFLLRLYRKGIRGHEVMLQKQYKGEKIKLDSRIITWKILKLFNKDYQGVCDRFLKIAMKYKKAPFVGLRTYSPRNKNYVFESAWFDEVVELQFEDRTIPCPVGYDETLRRQYGDYMVFEKGAAQHTMAFLDADTPYTEKLNLK